MSSGEKKVVVVMIVILVVLVAAYAVTGRSVSTDMEDYMAQMPSMPVGAPGADPSCAPGDAGTVGETQEYGQAGAKLEIIAVLPIAKGCHATTEQELKKAYEAHPDDIHLTIVDLMGPDASEYQEKVKVSWTVVNINGSSQFELDGRNVRLEQAENNMYRPSDIVPIVEAELAKS
jgi:hypothetical protein